MPSQPESWDDFLGNHPELGGVPDDSSKLDAYVVKHVADGGAKWIAVSDGVMYAQDMGSSILLGWAAPKAVVRRLADLMHAYNSHNDVDAAAELDFLLEGIVQVLAQAYVLNGSDSAGTEPTEAVTSPRWVVPTDEDDDDPES